MIAIKRLLAISIGTAYLMCAQVSPSFDVASVKSDPWAGNGMVGITVKGNTLEADHSCLYGLVQFAYKLRDDHLSGGPSWAKCGQLATSDLYQVIAKVSADPPPPMEQFRLMLQALLADRFQLKLHHAPKELPTFNLVLAPGGAKMKESAADGKFTMNMDARVNRGKGIHITTTHVSMEQLVQNFEYFAGRPLFDHTGLSGFYDFEISFDTDPDAPAADALGENFAVAIERHLGLKLVPATTSFDTVVIDQASKPSAN
jgi:uncharacterized protein (TIGR03435 family)